MKNFDESLTALSALETRYKQAQETAECYHALLTDELAFLIAEETNKGKDFGCATELFEEFEDRFPTVSPAALAVNVAKKLQKSRKNRDIFCSFGRMPEKGMSICYQKNSYIQRAADLCPKDTRFFYAEDYEDAAVRAANREQDACILPYIAPNGGKLPGIARLIEEQGLCKTELFFVRQGETGNAGYLLLTPIPLYRPNATHLELMIDPPNRLNFTELSLFAKHLGIHATFPETFSENNARDFSRSCILTFTGEAEDLKIAAEAIGLLCPESRVTGFYCISKEQALQN